MTATVGISVNDVQQAQNEVALDPEPRTVRFNDGIEVLPPVDVLEDEADHVEQESPWFSVSIFYDDAGSQSSLWILSVRFRITFIFVSCVISYLTSSLHSLLSRQQIQMLL